MLFDAETTIDSGLSSADRWPFVLGQARRLILLPLAIILGAVAWSDTITAWYPGAPNAASTLLLRFSPILVIVAALPLLLRWAWKTKSLPPSGLRQRLETHGHNSGCATRDILVWDTRNLIANAAITGVLPTLRYLMLSDRLVRDLSAEQVELIVLHELAHAKHKHQLKLMLGLAFSIACCGLFVTRMLQSGGVGYAIVCGIVAIVTVRIVGRYARGFELEADWWAAKRSANPKRYLHAMAHVASGNPRQATWLHPSFEERCKFLLKGLEPASDFLRSELRGNLVVLMVWGFALTAFGLALSSH